LNSNLTAFSRLQQQSVARKPQLLQNGTDGNDGSENFSVGSTDSSGNDTGSDEPKNEELWDAANKVEGFMIGFMMKQMRETVNRTEGLYERGKAEKMFRGRLDKKLAQRMAENKDFGIAETVYEQLSADNV
jgi:hypothetical protein